MTHLPFPLSICLLALCGGATAQVPPPPGNEQWWTPPSTDGVQRVTIHCSNNSFDPRTIVVKANTPVELTIRSLKNNPNIAFVMSHPGAQINQVIDSKQAPVRFDAGTVGRYAMLCRPTNSNAPVDLKMNEARSGTLIVIR